MHLTRNRHISSKDTEISFPLLECWNPMTEVATIAAQVNKQRVLCKISSKVLQRKFRASPEEPMQAVAKNRAAIQTAARKLIEKKAYEDDGTILIRHKDI